MYRKNTMPPSSGLKFVRDGFPADWEFTSVDVYSADPLLLRMSKKLFKFF
jgi:hypothetical protein